MHSNEFEISLLRELKICGNTIHRIKKTLALMEQKHHKTTDTFIEEYHTGSLNNDSDNKDDYSAWESSYESLTRWQNLERLYQEQLNVMKNFGKQSHSQEHGKQE
jgi:hypothetical protein